MQPESWLIGAGIIMCLLCLWAIGRHDWLRLTGISRQVTAEVIGHRLVADGHDRDHAAIYRFSAEGREHEVTDMVCHSTPQPAVGTQVQLVYPVGHPELARPPRPFTWLAVYSALVLMLGILVAKALGLLPE